MRALWTLSIPVVTLSGWFLARAGAPAWCWWLGAIYALGLHPAVDNFLAPLLKPTSTRSANRRLADLLLWLSFPLQAVVLAMALLLARDFDTSSSEFWAITLSRGISAGAYGITSAHELIHRSSKFERGLGVGNLVLCLFAHFRVEHVFVHHRWVGTSEDPATARLGESLYAFWVRSLLGGLVRTIRLEFKRGPWNRVVRDQTVQLLLISAVIAGFGTPGILLLVVQSLVAWLLLATVNYLEHYGLERRETAPGVREPLAARHSWESRHWLTNAALFNLGLHPQHHLQASQPYERLAPVEGSPQLPFGYSLALIVSMVPPLWRRIMDPRAREAMARIPASSAEIPIQARAGSQ
jgi:alkane 1-monooxygenase